MGGKNTAASRKGHAVDPSTVQALSPRSTTNRLLLAEDSLGEVRASVQNIHELLENVGHQLELISVEQERLRLDLGNWNVEERGNQHRNQPRNQSRTPEAARNGVGNERRRQDLQLRIQDSDSSDDK